ncbi:hypothetical protein [Christiangramia echinicola]|uniref:Uncharacterized protein n=1 Tax=Christiangramia echinicola TaxID=279359 RepID=A0A1H1KV29_9FLAO|nr:hypothetical protein [Christiangramia echinicola]SDR65842.1 hypothetical protein SAMN04488552_0202 [Christiangramia echinicola]
MKENKNQSVKANPLFEKLPKNPNGSLVPEEIPEEMLGTRFIGTGETEFDAMKEADRRACDYAKKRLTCFHPSRKYTRHQEGTIWVAQAIAANHQGSCPNLDRNDDCSTWEY